MAQLFLDFIRRLRNLAQVFQIVRRRLVENLEQEARLLVRAEQLGRALVEFADDRRFFETDRQNELVRHDDRKRQGIIAVLVAADRDIRQDHDRVVLDVGMRALLIVEGRAQEIGIDFRQIAHDFQLIGRRIDDVDPRPFLERLEREFLQRAALHRLVNLQHGWFPPFSWEKRHPSLFYP